MGTLTTDWELVAVKQDNLAGAMGFAYAGFADDAVAFFDKFHESGWMSRFERGDGRATMGCSGSELALMVYGKSGKPYQMAEFVDKCDFDTITTPVEYWIGYALGHIQGRSEMPFSEIFRHYPLEDWYKMDILHEVSDEVLWEKTMGRCIGDVQSEPEPYRFGGRQHPFSNYYPAPAAYKGMAFSTSEAAFQAAKTLDIDARRAFINIDPGKAKGDGRRLILRPDWELVKYEVMLEVLRSKFQDPALRKMLVDTGDRILVEDTTGWHDNEWGDCRCEKCANIPGKNMLGQALMEIRTKQGDGSSV